MSFYDQKSWPKCLHIDWLKLVQYLSYSHLQNSVWNLKLTLHIALSISYSEIWWWLQHVVGLMFSKDTKTVQG